jgi:hypothetical protein
LSEFKGTIEDCSNAIQKNPKNSQALNQRGLSKYQLSDNAGAKEDFKC